MERWGTGAMNIDKSRVGDEKVHNDRITTGMKNRSLADNVTNHNDQYTAADYERTYVEGRWPANFIHDGSQGVLDLFPDVKGGNWTTTDGCRAFNNNGKPTNAVAGKSDKSVGSAARSFYVPKVTKKDRNEGDIPNVHPTVKPLSLIHI